MLGISLSLALLILLVASNVTKEDVVGDGTESCDGVKKAGAEKEEGERGMDESIAEVAAQC